MAISHKNIPDSELHDPKGFSGAGNNAVLKTDTGGALEWDKINDVEIGSSAAIQTSKLAIDSVSTSNTGHTLEKLLLAPTALTASSSVVIARKDAEYSSSPVTNISFTTVAEIVMYQAGTVRAAANIQETTSGGGFVEIRFLKNGSQVGSTQAAIDSDGYPQRTQDITVAVGDTITIQVRSTDDGETVKSKNHRIYANNYNPFAWFVQERLARDEEVMT